MSNKILFIIAVMYANVLGGFDDGNRRNKDNVINYDQRSKKISSNFSNFKYDFEMILESVFLPYGIAKEFMSIDWLCS